MDEGCRSWACLFRKGNAAADLAEVAMPSRSTKTRDADRRRPEVTDAGKNVFQRLDPKSDALARPCRILSEAQVRADPIANS